MVQACQRTTWKRVFYRCIVFYIGYYEPSEDKMMRNYATTDPSDCYKTRYRSVADKERKKNLFLPGLSPARIFIYV